MRLRGPAETPSGSADSEKGPHRVCDSQQHNQWAFLLNDNCLVHQNYAEFLLDKSADDILRLREVADRFIEQAEVLLLSRRVALEL